MARGSKLRVATDERHVRLPGSHFPSGLFREYKLSKAPDPRLLVGPALSSITAALVNAKLDTMGSSPSGALMRERRWRQVRRRFRANVGVSLVGDLPLTIGARHGEFFSEVAPEIVGLERDDRPGVFRETTRANGGLVGGPSNAGVGAGPRDEFAERAILAVVVNVLGHPRVSMNCVLERGDVPAESTNAELDEGPHILKILDCASHRCPSLEAVRLTD